MRLRLTELDQLETQQSTLLSEHADLPLPLPAVELAIGTVDVEDVAAAVRLLLMFVEGGLDAASQHLTRFRAA
jgi:hypothetical protein